MAISAETIDKIKSLNISHILEQEGVVLKRVGREFITHCVWHEDKNPSLTISDQKGFVFCHVCREGGDAIHFVQKKYNLNFREACEKIANNNNIQIILKDEDPQIAIERKKQIDKQLDNVQQYQNKFRLALRQSQFAVDFIKKRNIQPITSKFFGLGYDANENRLVIPIKDFQGRIVGFTRRALDDKKPKYKNTENNIIFNKSEIVFNEYDALDSIRESGQCIFVEGHIDVMALWQINIKNVVALQGTASPSENVIFRMMRRTTSFVLCMDADEGGKKAISLFLENVKQFTLSGKLDVSIASIPMGKDPDEAITQGVNMKDVIANSISWIDWQLDQWFINLDFKNNTKVQEVEKHVRDLISQLTSSALRAHYYDKAAIRLAQNKQNLAVEILKNLQSAKPNNNSQNIWLKPDKLWTRNLVEKRLLRLYIHRPSLRYMLRPLMEKLFIPDMVWMWNRINELEEFSSVDCTPYSVMAILLSSEPRYLQKLRPLARPTIEIDDCSEVILHIEDTMMIDLNQQNEGILL